MSHTSDETWTLLGRVGLTRTGGSFDALADPVATDALAALLAERLQSCELDAVVVWEGLQSVVLGYAVGLRLGLPVIVLSDDEGLVSSATTVIRRHPRRARRRDDAAPVDSQNGDQLPRILGRGAGDLRDPARSAGWRRRHRHAGRAAAHEPAPRTLSRRDASPAPGETFPLDLR